MPKLGGTPGKKLTETNKYFGHQQKDGLIKSQFQTQKEAKIGGTLICAIYMMFAYTSNLLQQVFPSFLTLLKPCRQNPSLCYMASLKLHEELFFN